MQQVSHYGQASDADPRVDASRVISESKEWRGVTKAFLG